MKLSELQNMLTFDTDFADDTIDATFYTELEDILPKYAKQINVISISTKYSLVIKSLVKILKKLPLADISIGW